MKKKLIFGNSYAAAFKAADKQLQFDYVCYSEGKDTLEEFETCNRNLYLNSKATELTRKIWNLTTKSAQKISLHQYQMIYVVGIIEPPNPWLFKNFWMLQEKKPSCLKCLPPVTLDFILHSKINADTLSKLKSVEKLLGEDEKIAFIPKPHPRADIEKYIPNHKPPSYWNRLSEHEKILVTKNEQEIYKLFYKNLGYDVLIPPASTIENGNLCPVVFSEGALGTANFQPSLAPQWGNTPIDSRHNITHKNELYGQQWLKYLI